MRVGKSLTWSPPARGETTAVMCGRIASGSRVVETCHQQRAMFLVQCFSSRCIQRSRRCDLGAEITVLAFHCGPSGRALRANCCRDHDACGKSLLVNHSNSLSFTYTPLASSDLSSIFGPAKNVPISLNPNNLLLPIRNRKLIIGHWKKIGRHYLERTVTVEPRRARSITQQTWNTSCIGTDLSYIMSASYREDASPEAQTRSSMICSFPILSRIQITISAYRQPHSTQASSIILTLDL